MVDLDIIKDFRNDLLKRREVKLVLEEESNPGYTKSKEAIAKKFKSPEVNIVVKHLKSKFGRKTFLIDAFIYDSEEDRKRIEHDKKESAKKNSAKEAEKKVEAKE